MLVLDLLASQSGAGAVLRVHQRLTELEVWGQEIPMIERHLSVGATTIERQEALHVLALLDPNTDPLRLAWDTQLDSSCLPA